MVGLDQSQGVGRAYVLQYKGKALLERKGQQDHHVVTSLKGVGISNSKAANLFLTFLIRPEQIGKRDLSRISVCP